MHVCGSGVPRDLAEALAQLLGGTVSDCPGGKIPSDWADTGGAALLLGTPDDGALRAALLSEARLCYVLSQDFTASSLRPLPHHSEGDSLIVGTFLSARAAYDLPVASIIADAIGEKLDISPATRLNMDIALNEAVANSLIHGCLALQSPAERFDPEFIDAIDTRINDPAYGTRPIWVTVHSDAGNTDVVRILVIDEGAGFKVPDFLDMDAPEKASRGLGLIHAATIEYSYRDDGRCLEMKFSL